MRMTSDGFYPFCLDGFSLKAAFMRTTSDGFYPFCLDGFSLKHFQVQNKPPALAGGILTAILQLAPSTIENKQMETQQLKFIKPEMVLINRGDFMMGSPDGVGESSEHPQHKVEIYYDFEIGKYPVTCREYDVFLYGDSYGDCDSPVTSVSWHEAKAYCDWLSEQTGQTYCLPSEAEWEYACRAGSTGSYCFGEDARKLGEYAWYGENSDDETHLVGEKKPNAWGLYDVHGNVWEWCEDIWHKDYGDIEYGFYDMDRAPTDGSAWLFDEWRCSIERVIRGGSYDDDPSKLRSAYRKGALKYYLKGASENLGFRVARRLPPRTTEEQQLAELQHQLDDEGHYRDNGDGTVTDTKTGLMWQRCSVGRLGMALLAWVKPAK